MTDVFGDTSGWGNLVDASQPFHQAAADTYRATTQLGRRLVTTNYVIAELVTLMTRPLRLNRSRIIAFIDDLKKSPHVEIVHVDSALDYQAWQLLASRPDKEWSLVDCTSFVLMQQRSITESLTADHHFEQAGFVRLLR